MLRAVIYRRVSTKLQVEKYSLVAQERVLKDCIAKEHEELVEIYTDPGISGERIIDRPEFQRLLLDADGKKFDAVWVIDQDRLSRGDLADLAYIKKVFKENNIQLCTPYQKLSFKDIDDDFISDLFGILAKRERLKIKQRADRGRQIKAEKGEWGGRTPPYGYKFIPEKSKHLIIDEEEAHVYKLMVSLYLDKGLGLDKIAGELNKLGYKNRSGKPWSMKSIHYIIKNPTYKGILVHQKFRPYYTKANKKGWYDEKVFTEIPNAHPAIIPVGIFDLIQNRVRENRVRARTFVSLQLLTGLIECSLCHNSFRVGSTSQGKYRRWVYRCKTRFAHWFDKNKPTCSMRVFDVDYYNAKVWTAFQEVAKKPDLIENALEKSKTPHLSSLELYQKEYEQVTHKLNEFQAYKDNAVSLRIRSIISEDEFNTQILSLVEEQNNLEQRSRELRAKIEYFKRLVSEGVNRDTILRYAKFIYQSNKKLDIPQKRKILGAFVKKIPIYGNGEFETVYKFPILDPKNLSQVQEFQWTSRLHIGGSAAR